jgi:hypothetical protein
MKLIKTADTRTLIFNGVPFLKLVANAIKNDQKFDGKYSVPLEPWIECEKPRLFTKRLLHNEYEIVVYNIVAENYGDTNNDNHILRTRTSFIYTNQSGNSEKELFEDLLIQTDQYTTSHFFANVHKAKNKHWEIEPRTAAMLEDFEFLLVKLGTKYRPFPTIDHKEFFKV